MVMRIFRCLLLLLSFFSINSFGQESLFSENQGKPRALIFSNFHKDFTANNKSSAFEVTRAYLGYEYTFNPEWYGYIVLDVGDPQAGRNQFSAFLKNAFIRYRKSGLTFLFGMVPTTQFKVAEDVWGLRYVDEVFQDLYGFSSSADLGFTVQYQFADFIGADFSVFNGEGYHNLQGDDYMQPAAGITVHPVRVVTARLYADYMGGTIKQRSYSAFMAYQDNDLTAGAEYNFQQNVDMTEGRDRFGPSFFVTYNLFPNIKAFGRYDFLLSNTPEGENVPWQNNNDGQLIMAGVEYAPLRGIRFTPNYRMWKPEQNTLPMRHSIYLNCEVRF